MNNCVGKENGDWESTYLPKDGREKRREGKMRNSLQPRRWPRFNKVKCSAPLGLVKAK